LGVTGGQPGYKGVEKNFKRGKNETGPRERTATGWKQLKNAKKKSSLRGVKVKVRKYSGQAVKEEGLRGTNNSENMARRSKLCLPEEKRHTKARRGGGKGR